MSVSLLILWPLSFSQATTIRCIVLQMQIEPMTPYSKQVRVHVYYVGASRCDCRSQDLFFIRCSYALFYIYFFNQFDEGSFITSTTPLRTTLLRYPLRTNESKRSYTPTLSLSPVHLPLTGHKPYANTYTNATLTALTFTSQQRNRMF